MWSVEFTQSVLTHNDWLFCSLLFFFIIVVCFRLFFFCLLFCFVFVVVCLFALFCVVVVLGGVQLASRWGKNATDKSQIAKPVKASSFNTID